MKLVDLSTPPAAESRRPGAGMSVVTTSAPTEPHLLTHLQVISQRMVEMERLLQEAQTEIGELRQRLAAAEQDASTDPLTGIGNRRQFDRTLLTARREARENARPLTMLMVDIDHFKAFNDRFGHQSGDHVLRLVARSLASLPGGEEASARFGGDEFAVLLPGIGEAEAGILAEQLRRTLAARRFIQRVAGKRLPPVTVSIGVAEIGPRESGRDLIRRADAAVYRAKQGGRNTVELDLAPALAAAEAASGD